AHRRRRPDSPRRTPPPGRGMWRPTVVAILRIGCSFSEDRLNPAPETRCIQQKSVRGGIFATHHGESEAPRLCASQCGMTQLLLVTTTCRTFAVVTCCVHS